MLSKSIQLNNRKLRNLYYKSKADFNPRKKEKKIRLLFLNFLSKQMAKDGKLPNLAGRSENALANGLRTTIAEVSWTR